MYEIMFYAGVVCFVLGCIVTAILFVKNDIAKTIGDVTGHNAKKAVKKMRQEREEKEKSDAVVKKEKRRFFGKLRDDKTSVLSNQNNSTDVLQKTDDSTDVLPKTAKGKNTNPKEKTDILPQPSQRSEEILQKAQAVMKPQEEQKPTLSGEMDFSSVFQVEEEMTVLGGEIVDTLPTTILSEDISFGSGLDADLEADTNVLKGGTTESLILPDGISALWDGSAEEDTTSVLREEATDVLATEETTSVLAAEEATDVLTTEEATSVLAAEEATDVLTTDESTSVLVAEEATDVLTTDEATSVLAGNDEVTSL